jgi:hypothetical protein
MTCDPPEDKCTLIDEISARVSGMLAQAGSVIEGLTQINEFIEEIPVLGGLIRFGTGIEPDGAPISDGARASALAGAVTEAASGGLVAGVERKFVGNAISGFTKHGINQVINRGVKPAALLDAARNGTARGPLIDRLGRESLRITGRAAEFAINLLGRVTSAWRR